MNRGYITTAQSQRPLLDAPTGTPTLPKCQATQDLENFSNQVRVNLWSGLILGIGQTISLGVGGWILSGLHQLSPVNRYVLWCMALIGALIGFVALPPTEVSYGISWPVVLANGLGLAIGALVLKYVLVSRFESKVLQWTVLAMCFSVWGHVLVKHFILPS